MWSQDNTPRRKFLKLTGGSIAVTGLAGCTSGDGSGNDSGGGSSGGGSSGDEEPQFQEFDPENPRESLPQLAVTLWEAGLWEGSEADLENMEPKDEPRYGPTPNEYATNEDEWLDPDTIQFSRASHEEPAAYEDAAEPLIENMEAETGKKVDYFVIDSVAAQVEAMRSDRLHVCAFGAGIVPYAVGLAGAVPEFMHISEEGRFGYRLWLITQADNDEINAIEDLEGRTIAHTSPGSNSGNMAPRAFFANEGVVPGEDYEIEFSGSHENSILGVARGDYDAAPVSSAGGINQAIRGGAIEGTEIKVIWYSDPFPGDPESFHYRLHPDIREGLTRAYLDYDYAGTSWQEFFGRSQFVEIDYATHWDSILTIQENIGQEYDADNL